MVAAPTVVVVTLLAWHNVWATFALYHLGICILAPIVDRRMIHGESWREMAHHLGLLGPRLRAGAITGLVLGVLMAAATVVFFEVFGDRILDSASVLEVLAGWGVTPQRTSLLILVMVLGNGAAEELFWRGWIHRRLASWRKRSVALFVGAFFYASYHAVTVTLFVGNMALAVLFLFLILGAGVFWGWLRVRFGNLWPALLSHIGATAGYMLVYATQIVTRG